MTHHTELLNFIADGIQAKTYLEIGCYNLDHNFNHIKVPFKIGVDPDPNAGATFKITSDEFFKYNTQFFDLIFIDGLHEAEQVKKDISNAFDYLYKGGVIVLHDCNPPTEATTCFPRGAQREWCGTVYKTICNIVSPKITIDMDYGCCVLLERNGLPEFDDSEITWPIFEMGRKTLLNLMPVQEFLKICFYADARQDNHHPGVLG